METLLEAVMARAGHAGDISGLQRLSGGANMESWAFACGDDRFVLRRAPSAEWIAARSLGMNGEAELIRQAHASGVKAPEVVAELTSADGLGIGFIMRCLPGTADPEHALSSPPELAADLAAAMAGIHALSPEGLPFLPVLDPAEGVEGSPASSKMLVATVRSLRWASPGFAATCLRRHPQSSSMAISASATSWLTQAACPACSTGNWPTSAMGMRTWPTAA